ncbi:MAG: 5'/3'-nucleotidase SurE [Acidimicrobiales bacterium]
MKMHHRSTKAIGATLVVAALFLAGCSSSGSDSASKPESTTTAAPKTLKILITNDDGYNSDGINAIIEAMRTQPNVEITVVAPVTQQSGKGGTVTGGTLTASDLKTKDGFPVKAVNGTPADAIIWATEQKGISFTPDFVISGINAGGNLGPVIDLSGTIGAARAAVQRGIPAIAASNGALVGPFAPAESAEIVLRWFEKNREAIANGTIDKTQVFNLNIPTCATGSVRGEVLVPISTTDISYFAQQPNCASTAPNPGNDVGAYMIGFAPLSMLSMRPAA